MGNCVGIIRTDQRAIYKHRTTRELIVEPSGCFCVGPLSELEIVNNLSVPAGKCVDIVNTQYPERNRVVTGPCVAVIESAWERFERFRDQTRLDQDDYTIVTSLDGLKKTIRGPGLYVESYGDRVDRPQNAIMVPRNHYIEIQDSNDAQHPVKRFLGPLKFIPEPFQTVVQDPKTKKPYFECYEINETQAIHLQNLDGSVVLFATPGFYMPLVGQKVLEVVEKTILLESQFCVIKGQDGLTYFMDGSNPNQRAFFLQPFHDFIGFVEDKDVFTVLSKQPKTIPQVFNIRTQDNVVLKLDIRTTYRIANPEIFTKNPIQYRDLLSVWTQNALLDCFAQIPLRTFQKTYTSVAQKCIEEGTAYFAPYGIVILDVQVLNFSCVDTVIQQLLEEEIKTVVTKENEIRAKEAGIVLKQKEAQIEEMGLEMELKRATLEQRRAEERNKIKKIEQDAELDLRKHALENQIEEEQLKTKLLEALKTNSVKEGEFEGKARGMTVAGFLGGLPASVSIGDALELWRELLELDKTVVQASAGINFYPEGSKFKLNLGATGATGESKVHVPSILRYEGGQRD